MKRGRFSEEQIIGMLKRHEAGQKVSDLAREHGVSEATICTWKNKYGGLEVSEAQRLRQLEDENRRLKHLVADLSLDKEVLKAVISKKRLELAARRQDVGFAVETFGISERRACGLLGVWRSRNRYACKPDRNAELRKQLVALAHERPRFGYRRLGVLLEREGAHVNHKRLFRVYREAGLSVKRNRRKKLVRIVVSQPVLAAPNDEWSLDFVYDALANGRSVRVLGVVDNFTRACLALEVDTSFASQRVTRILDAVMWSCALWKRICLSTQSAKWAICT